VKSLPDFPWDTISKFRSRAENHPDGLIDLSVGTPVDDVPEIIQAALREHSNTPGYPTTIGTIELRTAAIGWMSRQLGVKNLNLRQVIPTIGSKELIAWLPTILDLDANRHIAIPAIAYPTYEVSAIIAGHRVLWYSSIQQLIESTDSGIDIGLVWLNSPSNPTGEVLSATDLKQLINWAQSDNIVVASDECYIELGWDTKPISILNSTIAETTQNLLAVHSLSKRSNLAGYRAGLLSGDQVLIEKILEFRKHAGMIMPAPIQYAMTVALEDDVHVQIQRERYQQRRTNLKAALELAGFVIDNSEAGLYLWVSQGRNARDTLAYFAERGILVAPGDFYGDETHCRVALTATDAAISSAVSRLKA
jgi:succinyldiaminopimelate transaminase